MLRNANGILLALVGFVLAAGCKQYDPTARMAGGTTAATAMEGGGDPNAVVATIDGKPVTMAELEEDIKPELTAQRNKYLEEQHALREQGLERLIDKRLIERKAKAAGVTEEEYFKREVVDKIPEPSEEEMRALYDRVAASAPDAPPFEEARAEIVAYMKQQRGEGAVEEFRQKLRAEAKVTTSLPPLLLPKVDLSAVKGPSKGDAKAPVTIVEFSDYECGFCKRADPTVAEVLAAYPGKVRVIMAHYPLPNHPGAQKAAEAALCADDQGKHWEMHGKLFDNQDALAPDDLKKYAGELGLDAAKFAACLDGGAKAPQVKESVEWGRDAGVNSTPMFFINGRPLSGAQPVEAFKELIDMELANKT